MSPSRYRLLATVVWFLACPWALWPTFTPPLTAFFLTSLLGLRLGAWWRQGRSLRTTSLDPFLLFYLIAVALAFLVSPAPALGLPKLTTVALGAFGYFLVQDWLVDGRNHTYLFLLLAMAGAAIVFITPFIIEWPARQVIDLQFLSSVFPHLTGDFSAHSNQVAGTLLFLLPFTVALWQGPGSRRRWMGVVLTFLVMSGLLLSQSRGALLGLFVAVAAWLAWGRLPLKRVFLVVGLILVVVLGAALAADVDGEDVTAWAARLDAMSKTGSLATSSLPMRREIWGAALSALGDYPVFGAGLYAFVPVSRANYAFNVVRPTVDFTHAHNLALQTGVSLGWPGLLALSGMWLTVLAGAWQVNADRRSQAAIYGASILGYLTYSLFDVISLGQRPGFLLWLILAGAAALPAAERRRAAPRHNWWQYSPLLLAIGLVLSPLLERNVANWRLDRVRIASERAISLSVGDYAGDPRRQGLVAFLQSGPEAALRYWRRDADATTFLQSLGAQASAAGRQDTALEWYKLALRLDGRRATVYFWRGLLHLEAGSLQQAQADFRHAATFAESNGLDGPWEARIYFHQGRVEVERQQWHRAASHLQRAVAMDDVPLYYQLLGDVLVRLGDEDGAAAAYGRAQQSLHQ